VFKGCEETMKVKKSYNKLDKNEKVRLTSFFNTFNAFESMTEEERVKGKKEYYKRGGWKLV